MDPEVKRILDETHALAKENHRILRAIRRDQWLGFVAKVVVWVIVLALPLYFYQQYVQPLLQKMSAPQTGTSSSGNLFLPGINDLRGLLQK